MSTGRSNQRGSSASSNQLDQLLSLLVDSEPTVEEHEELSQHALQNDSNIERFVDHVVLDTLLQEELSPESLVEVVDLQESAPPTTTKGGPAHELKRWRGKVGWLATAASLAIVAFFVGRFQTRAFASASDVIHAALDVHSNDVQREYLVDVVWEDSETAESIPPKDVRVTTWGDKFWISIEARRRFSLGSEPDSSVWIALSPLRGMRIEQDELGPLLRDVTDIYSLRLESMLEGVLQEHDLAIVESTAATYVVVATPRRKRGWIRNVTVAVDRETKTVRRMVAKRRSLLRGPSMVTFTLVETTLPDESQFQLAGHLDSESVVLTGDSTPDLRREVLENVLGPVTRGWILERDAVKP